MSEYQLRRSRTAPLQAPPGFIFVYDAVRADMAGEAKESQSTERERVKVKVAPSGSLLASDPWPAITANPDALEQQCFQFAREWLETNGMPEDAQEQGPIEMTSVTMPDGPYDTNRIDMDEPFRVNDTSASDGTIGFTAPSP